MQIQLRPKMRKQTRTHEIQRNQNEMGINIKTNSNPLTIYRNMLFLGGPNITPTTNSPVVWG